MIKYLILAFTVPSIILMHSISANDLFIQGPITLISTEANLSITTSKIAKIHGEINVKSYESFKKEMVNTRHLKGDRVILINSPGGRVDYGNKMIEDMRAEQVVGTKVICYVEKYAASMAFNFLTNCDVRLMSIKGIAVFHKIASGDLSDEGRLTAKNLRRIADELEKDDINFRKDNAKAMGISLQDYDMFADNETYWTALELFNRGYLHGFGTLKK